MPKTEPPKRAQRPRIDGIINAIRRGEYDDKAKEIQAALDARADEKKAEIAKLVKEVYGEDYDVRPKLGQQARAQAPIVSAPGQEAPPAPEGWKDVTADLSAEAVNAGQVTAEGVGVAHTGGIEDDPDFESRSPIIGPMPNA